MVHLTWLLQHFNKFENMSRLMSSAIACLVVCSSLALSYAATRTQTPTFQAETSKLAKNQSRSQSREFNSSSNDKRFLLFTKPSQIDQNHWLKRSQSEGSPVEDPTSSDASEPRWTDACNKRASINDTLISIIIGPQTKHASHVIEEDRQLRGKFFKHGLEPEPPGRTRRSIPSSGGGLEETNLLTVGLEAPDQSGSSIWYKQPKGRGAKKTSFAAARGNKYSKSKSRYYLSPWTASQQQVSSHPIGKQFAKSTQGSGSQVAKTNPMPLSGEMRKIVQSIFANDIKLSWHINCALNTATSARRAADLVNQSIQSELNETKIGIATGESRRWIPNLESLLVKPDSVQKQNGLGRSQRALTNVTHYIQFFNVAFEQMLFEQVSFGTKSAHLYWELERDCLKLLCDTETLVRSLELLNEARNELVKSLEGSSMILDGDVSNSLRALNISVVNSMERRLRYDKASIQSPFVIWRETQGGGGNSMVAGAFIPRAVMPLSQRKLTSNLERNIRNQFILADFKSLVGYYESMLANIYA